MNVIVRNYTDSSAGYGVHKGHIKTRVGTTARGHYSIEEYSMQMIRYNTILTLQMRRDTIVTGRLPDLHLEDDELQQLMDLCQADFF